MRKLSKSYKFDKYAKCPHCFEVFLDDIPLCGSLKCPTCKGVSLERDVEKSDIVWPKKAIPPLYKKWFPNER